MEQERRRHAHQEIEVLSVCSSDGAFYGLRMSHTLLVILILGISTIVPGSEMSKTIAGIQNLVNEKCIL